MIFRIFIFIIIFPNTLLAQSGLNQHLRDFIEKTEKSVISPASVGIYISDAQTGKELFNYQGEKLMIPASVQKLLITLAALRNLGAEYKFPTEIFLDNLPKDNDPRLDTSSGVGSVRESGLKSGNLYLRGYGDPSLLVENLWKLASEIYRLGVREIDNIVIDDTLFINPPGASGEKSYQAALGAVTLDQNCYSIFISPSGSGLQSFVSLTPGSGFEIQNRVKSLSTSGSNFTITQSPSSEMFNPRAKSVKVGQYFLLENDKVEVSVQGYIGIKEDVVVLYRTVPNPSAYFGAIFQYMLQQMGVSIKGQLLRGETPGSAKLFITHESKPLVSIINDLNHYSSNFVAGQLVYAMGQDNKGFFRFEKGLEKVSEVLMRLGEKKEDFKITDGSGLEKENRLSPKQVVKVLVEVYKDFSVFPDFVSSLSKFGHSGTLKKRQLFNEEELRKYGLFSEEDKRKADSVWAKTGTLDEVSSVAGYLETKTEKRFAYAMISNGIIDNEFARALEDDLVRTLILYDK